MLSPRNIPNSELKAALYVRAMNLYGQANNSEKVIELGRKAIAADPTNPVSLVQVGSALVEGTRDTDMDRDQRLAEAAKDAQGAIDNIDQLMVPPDAPADRVAAVKASILTMAYDTLGMVDLNKKDAAGAEQEFLKAVDASKAQPEAVVFLRLSVAQDQLKKYPEALDSANKAVQYAPPGSAAQNLAKQQQDRLQKLMAGGSQATVPGIPSSICSRRAARTRRLRTRRPRDSRLRHRPRRLQIRVRRPSRRRTTLALSHPEIAALLKPSNAHDHSPS